MPWSDLTMFKHISKMRIQTPFVYIGDSNWKKLVCQGTVYKRLVRLGAVYYFGSIIIVATIIMTS